MLNTLEGAQQVTAILQDLHNELQADIAKWPDRLDAVIAAAGRCGCDECQEVKDESTR